MKIYKIIDIDGSLVEMSTDKEELEELCDKFNNAYNILIDPLIRPLSVVELV